VVWEEVIGLTNIVPLFNGAVATGVELSK